MPQKKHKPEEIVAKLRQVDVLLSQGRPVAEAIRMIGVTAFAKHSRVNSITFSMRNYRPLWCDPRQNHRTRRGWDVLAAAARKNRRSARGALSSAAAEAL